MIGYVGSGWKIVSAIGKRSVESDVINQVGTRKERPKWQLTSPTRHSRQRCSRAASSCIVDFWAEWCGPCHAVAPVLEKIAEEQNLKLVKVNIDENQDLAMRYGVQSIPNMVLFEAGEPKASAVGAMPKGMLERSLGLGE